ncbi:hypothetical protein Y032_0002g1128 [Ancylostoma ceylanicum]|uniref:Chromo domain-containing protein n=1 Tax=Ancylostoma ceylanicum TaxID=53326 RepID=A0A016W1G2_9BILA|nr:hypothetical protein Y032_0002g1128 [Ancylostoma ceylanicum]
MPRDRIELACELDSTIGIDDPTDMAPRTEKRVKYLVEKILDTRKVNGEREYLILWQDYGIEEASWEKAKHCECPDAIANYYKKRREALFEKTHNSPTAAYALRRKEKPPRPRARLTRSSAHLANSAGKAESQPGRIRDDHQYKIQDGRKIEAIIGVKLGGPEILYTVQYKGSEPKDKRTECVPSSVLRECAIEDFVECLEQLALASCEDTIML